MYTVPHSAYCQFMINARIMTDTLLERHFTHLCFLLRQYNTLSAAAMAAIGMSGPCLFGITTEMRTPDSQRELNCKAVFWMLQSSFAEQLFSSRNNTDHAACGCTSSDQSVCMHLSHNPVHMAYCNACKRAVFTCKHIE